MSAIMKKGKGISSAVLLALAVAGCSTGNADVQLPEEDPDIRGTITQVDRAEGSLHIMVEADPSDSVMSANPRGTPKSRVRIMEDSQLLEREEEGVDRIAADDLEKGDLVAVWFNGPVLQSYPSQSGAAVVVLERDE